MNMANFVILRRPVTILVRDFTNPDNLTNDLLIFKDTATWFPENVGAHYL